MNYFSKTTHFFIFSLIMIPFPPLTCMKRALENPDNTDQKISSSEISSKKFELLVRSGEDIIFFEASHPKSTHTTKLIKKEKERVSEPLWNTVLMLMYLKKVPLEIQNKIARFMISKDLPLCDFEHYMSLEIPKKNILNLFLIFSVL